MLWEIPDLPRAITDNDVALALCWEPGEWALAPQREREYSMLLYARKLCQRCGRPGDPRLEWEGEGADGVGVHPCWNQSDRDAQRFAGRKIDKEPTLRRERREAKVAADQARLDAMLGRPTAADGTR